MAKLEYVYLITYIGETVGIFSEYPKELGDVSDLLTITPIVTNVVIYTPENHTISSAVTQLKYRMMGI